MTGWCWCKARVPCCLETQAPNVWGNETTAAGLEDFIAGSALSQGSSASSHGQEDNKTGMDSTSLWGITACVSPTDAFNSLS